MARYRVAKRFCIICGESIDKRKENAKYCKTCAIEKNEKWREKYRKSKAYKTLQRRYAKAMQIYLKEYSKKTRMII